MPTLFQNLLARPGDALPWGEIAACPWWQALADCPQDAEYHAEGDVAFHTRMVVDELQAASAWRALGDDDRGVLLLAALLHDVGKPDTTRRDPDTGRITSFGHSSRGATLARRLLWEAGDISFATREAVCGLIRHHQRPFYLLDADDPQRTALTIAQSARCDLLEILADADTRGRISANRDDALLKVALFGEFCREQGCYGTPYPWASAESRIGYFRTIGRDPAYHAHEPANRTEMVLLSGLPGAGKDTYAGASGLPVVSLDAVRGEMGVAPTDGQEPVIARAREQARDLLRRGESFVWNATNLSREMRSRPLALAHDYNARVVIVYVEAPPAVLDERNRRRKSANNGASAIPAAAWERMLRRWEIPDETEAHVVTFRVAE